MNTNDGLSYAARVDTSEYDAALDHMAEKVSGVTSQIEQESARIQQLISSSIPEVDLKFLHDDTPTLNAIGEAYAHIARVIRENNEAVVELQDAYRHVTDEANKYANVPGRGEYVKELRQQRKAIQEVIAARKEVIAAAQAEEKELQKNEKSLVAAANAAEKQANSTQSLRQRIRELTMEAAALRDAEQAQGREIDKTTGRYREIIEELGRLRDIQGDIQAAGNVFANDENQFAGVISGLTGLSGAFSAAQGAVGLFAGENEHLQEIMLKVQSLMAITMGLQQVQQTLNKDSAFSLVTLNSLKQTWNKLIGKSASAQTQEAAATATATAAQNANTTATAENAAVTEAETAAQQANNSVTTAGAGAQATNTTQTSGDTPMPKPKNRESKKPPNSHSGIKSITTGRIDFNNNRTKKTDADITTEDKSQSDESIDAKRDEDNATDTESEEMPIRGFIYYVSTITGAIAAFITLCFIIRRLRRRLSHKD